MFYKQRNDTCEAYRGKHATLASLLEFHTKSLNEPHIREARYPDLGKDGRMCAMEQAYHLVARGDFGVEDQTETDSYSNSMKFNKEILTVPFYEWTEELVKLLIS